jgi:hypothetical protein
MTAPMPMPSAVTAMCTRRSGEFAHSGTAAGIRSVGTLSLGKGVDYINE